MPDPYHLSLLEKINLPPTTIHLLAHAVAIRQIQGICAQPDGSGPLFLLLI
jgi:hypothetical protein